MESFLEKENLQIQGFLPGRFCKNFHPLYGTHYHPPWSLSGGCLSPMVRLRYQLSPPPQCCPSDLGALGQQTPGMPGNIRFPRDISSSQKWELYGWELGHLFWTQKTMNQILKTLWMEKSTAAMRISLRSLEDSKPLLLEESYKPRNRWRRNCCHSVIFQSVFFLIVKNTSNHIILTSLV